MPNFGTADEGKQERKSGKNGEKDKKGKWAKWEMRKREDAGVEEKHE